MGSDTQVFGNVADLVPVPVSAHEKIAILFAQIFQKPVQIPSQFFGIISGFHSRQCRYGFFQFVQSHIIIAVTLLRRIEIMPVENTYSFNWGYDGVDKLAPASYMGNPNKLKELINKDDKVLFEESLSYYRYNAFL